MTEDDAKTKWCPFARIDDGSGALVAWNRRTQESLGHRRENLCIASACMAWRTEGEPGPHSIHKSARASWERHGWVTDGQEDANGCLTFTRGADGFCGLAGAPQ